MFFVERTIKQLAGEFSKIPDDRKHILRKVSEFISERIDRGQTAELVFICTHNSRRSHIAQVWAQAAAAYFNVSVKAYSGGTEATAFNTRAVSALQEAGFKIHQLTKATNPKYEVSYSNEDDHFEVFSKKYDDPGNPVNGFAAIMTCTHAEENCPVVTGAAARISLPYDDPKDYDGTSQESIKYRERVMEIGREILFLFSIT